MLNKDVCRKCWVEFKKDWGVKNIDFYFDSLIMVCPWMRYHQETSHIHTYGPPPKQCPFALEHTVS